MVELFWCASAEGQRQGSAVQSDLRGGCTVLQNPDTGDTETQERKKRVTGRDPATRARLRRRREFGGSSQLERQVDFRNSVRFLRVEAHRPYCMDVDSKDPYKTVGSPPLRRSPGANTAWQLARREMQRRCAILGGATLPFPPTGNIGRPPRRVAF
jgi:hypothetical protein